MTLLVSNCLTQKWIIKLDTVSFSTVSSQAPGGCLSLQLCTSSCNVGPLHDFSRFTDMFTALMGSVMNKQTLWNMIWWIWVKWRISYHVRGVFLSLNIATKISFIEIVLYYNSHLFLDRISMISITTLTLTTPINFLH